MANAHLRLRVSRPLRRETLKIHPLGDTALVIQLGSRIDEALSADAQALADRLRRRPGVQDALASYCTVTVHYDPELVSYQVLRAAVKDISRKPTRAIYAGCLHRIPVIYDGPDLVEVARALGLSVADLIELHSSATYRVFLIGFSPGLPYLGPLPARLQLPRRTTPRTRVPAGAVAIAGHQATVYTWPSPGGWHILGRTAMQLVLLDKDPPALLRAGDRVEFVPQQR
jgi:KipI family sensor histidine kinase inhibitor